MKKIKSSKPRTQSPFEVPVDIEVHKEYIAYHKNVDVASQKEWALKARDCILKKKTPLEEKKKIIFVLGHIPEMKALYGIQKYLRNPDTELEGFAALAWLECQQAVLSAGMSELLGADDFIPPLVMSGLGGDGQNLRYEFVLSTIGSKDTIKEHIKMLKRIIEKERKSKGAQIEEVIFRPNFIMFTSLVSHDRAVGDHIERLIAAINTEKKILRHHWQIYF